MMDEQRETYNNLKSELHSTTAILAGALTTIDWSEPDIQLLESLRELILELAWEFEVTLALRAKSA